MSNQVNEQDYFIVWQPIPGTSQELAIDSRCHHTLYHGARGPGKTITQIMRYRRRVGLGYGSFWRGVIFDREFKNLSDIVTQSKRFFTQFDDGCRFLSGNSEYKWVWPTGEELLLRHAKKPKDYDGFHGHEYPYIGWNELTKWPTSELYDSMMSTNRSTFRPEFDTPIKLGTTDEYDTPDGLPLPPIPLEVFSTTNPSGPGHHWVKRRFITAAPVGEVVRKKIPVFNPQTQKDEIYVKTQVAIFGSYRENIYLPPGYVAELENISDPNKKAAWLKGSWDVNAGGAFDDLWSKDVHIMPRFKVPFSWKIDRAFDWGSTHPFWVGWFAEASGEEATLEDGTIFCPPAGTLVMLFDWYGTDEIGTNRGLKTSPKNIARGIKTIEMELINGGWIMMKPRPGPADNQISEVKQSDVDTIETQMLDEDVRWGKSDKSQGSRINGFQLFRDRLEASTCKEGAGIYFMTNCQGAIQTIPALPRDDMKPDDVDTDAEDHPWDGVRYRVLKGSNRLATSIPVTLPT